MDPRIPQTNLVQMIAGLGIVVAIFSIALGGRWRPWLLVIGAIILATYIYMETVPPPR